MSIKIMSEVWDSDLTDQHETMVMLVLANHADDEGRCYPSLARIARLARMTDRGVRKVIRRLTEQGYLAVEIGGGRGGANRYLVIANPEPGSAPRNTVPPEPGSAPRNTATVNPEPGDHKPGTGFRRTLKNHHEPYARDARARGAGGRSGGRAEKPGTVTGPGDGGLLGLMAEKIRAGAYVAPSALKSDQVRQMIALKMVTETQMRAAGFNW